MPSSKHTRRQHKTPSLPIPLLGITVGVIYFSLPLLLLGVTPSEEVLRLVGLLIALWLVGGLLFIFGVVHAWQDSPWAPFLLAGPAIAFSFFCVLSLLSGFGTYILRFFE